MNMHDAIIANLDSLNDAHREQKPKFLSKGLPFYTCIDAARDLWTKETPDGKTELVKREYDFKRKMTIDTPVR